jgi:glutaconate CoA-transferase subunit B
MSTAAAPTTDFLVRAAREFRRGGWVFTGFHWPVLAGHLAHELSGSVFTQVFEAGASAHEAGRLVPTSTTDYPAYGNALGYVGDTAGVLLAMARRFDRVVLDASNVDVLGCINSSYLGERSLPTVRLPGGGGAADVAAAAVELVLLSGGDDVRRIQHRVEHVTARPREGALVRLHTRWGIVRLGASPQVEEIAELHGTDSFLARMGELGVGTTGATARPSASREDRTAAARVLAAAADRGYAVGRRAAEEVRTVLAEEEDS